ncbi:hypothetical protein FHS43_003744 [Streptosporangium becharense]|uniref:DUF6879 domain-containing protein n=1 Tax=Streptosporangium becharense TaxID=1816182 RepID=A0A7W9MHQ7_9ACTN|nr:DUF6879 family protein [Streptosporangium becharense]MBB2912461.1 hypothetical protein [Streptosporangium becharense]MBB5820709.1 hypothetical protein [Streptosporangium becharense]
MKNVFDRVRKAPGVVMSAKEYRADFVTEFEAKTGVVWKLERAQHFDERGLPSWEAFARGDWDRSLALMEDMRQEFAADHPERIEFRRIRVVEEPISPYVHWELAVLRVRAQEGERGRVVPASAVTDFETGHPVPELVAFGPSLMYEVLYDREGVHTGGRRITEPDVIEPCLPVFASLYERAEDLVEYFDRVVTPLPPPRLVP